MVFRTRIFDFVHPRMDVHILNLLGFENFLTGVKGRGGKEDGKVPACACDHMCPQTHAQYQKDSFVFFWYCAWCVRTHVIAGAGMPLTRLLPPSTRHARQNFLKTEQIWTSIRGWKKSKILVRRTTRGEDFTRICASFGPLYICKHILHIYQDI